MKHTTPKTREQIIDDAAFALDMGCTEFAQLEALFTAIRKDSQEHTQVWRLAQLGAYLAMDFGNLMDCERETFEDMKAVES